jgi:hypothetical protein
MNRRRGCWIAVLLAGAGACSNITRVGDASPGDDDAGIAPDGAPGPDGARGPDASPPDADVAPASGVDILFVVDDSGSMAEEQATLLAGLSAFVAELAAKAGGELPSLHVGVVSTNLGAGGFPITNCAGDGDGAVLQNAPRVPGCSAPAGQFIVDAPDGAGGRIVNYASGTLDQAIACIARLGTDGCGFEQPLEAMRRALDGSVAANAGFLREGALLVVILLGDEDDCSAANPALYDPAGPWPVTSFRCFEEGVVCSPDEPTAPGPKLDCRSREDSLYTHSAQAYVDFLKSLKPPGHVVLVRIAGDLAPVSVGVDASGNPLLEASCSSAAGDAAPAIRMAQVTAAFGSDAIASTICAVDHTPALVPAAAKIAGKL